MVRNVTNIPVKLSLSRSSPLMSRLLPLLSTSGLISGYSSPRVNSEVVKVPSSSEGGFSAALSSTEIGVSKATGNWSSCLSSRIGDCGGVFGRKCNLQIQVLVNKNVLKLSFCAVMVILLFLNTLN